MAQQQNGALPPSKDNQQTPEQTRQATQDSQDRNRPDQNQAGQSGQKDVANDSSNQQYGLTDTDRKEVPDRDVANEPSHRIDHL